MWDDDRYSSYPCRGSASALEKYQPQHWKSYCLRNNLHIEIDNQMVISLQGLTDQDHLRQYAYRELANHLTFIANNIPESNLNETDIVAVKVKYPILAINAVTEGKQTRELRTLQKQENIAQHLRATVQVQEVWKD